MKPLFHTLTLTGLALVLTACGQSDAPGTTEMPESQAAAEVETAVEEMAAGAADAMQSVAGAGSLAAVLATQPEEAQARYGARHPMETLEFFGVEPGMDVIEALPGGGWYTKILAPYLGTEGTLVGVDYNKALFPLFGFFTEEQLAAKETWAEDWRAEAQGWFDEPVADIDAYQFGSMPEGMAGDADAILFIRALHNLARFEDDGGFLTEALADSFTALKPGGIVGVVQHMAPEDAPAEWADGSAGYLKKSDVIAAFDTAGFEMVAESDINVNPLDQPTTDDIVWRLPPTLMTARENPEDADKYNAIGESTRMTLLFRKPQ